MSKITSIDAVITWVDGNDPEHQKKINPFLSSLVKITDDIAGKTRYQSEGEIKFCVASIIRFAPFVRKIFIVTDQQNPNLEEFILTTFTNNLIPVEIIDHSVLFKGFERLLPVFNSISIETFLFRIPDLSENFVYFNDDFFLVRPVTPENWFVNDKLVIYGYWRSIIFDSLLSVLSPIIKGHKHFGYKDSLINATKILGVKRRYFYMDHAPLPLKKSIFMNFFNENPSYFIENAHYKFRNEKQFNPQSLIYLLANKMNLIENHLYGYSLFIKPANKTKSYFENKIADYEKNKKVKFCCIESIDKTERTEKNKIFNWLNRVVLHH